MVKQKNNYAYIPHCQAILFLVYSSCVIDGTTIKDRDTLIKYLQKTVEDYDALLNGVNDHDRPPLNSGILSTLTNSRNNYKYYLEKLEA